MSLGNRWQSAGFVGVLMLDTRFPRPLGDIGNPDTFSQHGLPSRHMIVTGAQAHAVVRGPRGNWLPEFMAAARQLEREGAALITTTCGFLAEFQPALQAAVRVPVLSSALLQCQDHLRCGIVTFDARALTPAVLGPVGAQPDTPVEGLSEGSELHRVIYGDLPTLDMARARDDVVAAAQQLVRRCPDIDTIVLECANMPPYRDAVARATGRQVLDALTLVLAFRPLSIPSSSQETP